MRIARVLIIGTVAALGVGLGASPAFADLTAETDATFSVSGGDLAITAPAGPVDLGDGAPGTTIISQLGAVEVIDARAQADATWEAQVVSTDFKTAATVPTATEIVAATLIDYWSGPPITPLGSGTNAGQADATALFALTNATPHLALKHTLGTGNNSVSWNPTLQVRVPLANEAGDYSGTVTHSFA